ncbi:MAG: anthranilate synthase component II, partial [Victivallaceae bacterium]
LIKACAGKIPMLGICLGHQAIGEAFGGNIIHARAIMHGKVSEVTHDGKGIYKGLTSPLKAVRYHSLAIEEKSIPACLEITARTEDGEIMGIRHNQYLIEGIQYHPESILTPTGKRQLANFIEEVKKEKSEVRSQESK